ncbi:MAG: transglycosylase SLT domain-containing protein [Thermomicrobiales bacterium]|nr:transglycosylase SLT domain-containing protein [Thermomicrobiales bacterium]MCO5219995.1 transglycosylase SLT domain-containing protein [Thermomicrobiales bacterium]
MAAPLWGGGPVDWGRTRRWLATFLVALTVVSAGSVVFADTTTAQIESDAVLRWLPEIQTAAAATGVPAEVIAAVIRVESGGDPNVVSVAGAIGLMQVMPYEFQSQGIPESSWYDPATNIMAGSTEIGRFLAETGSIEQALATYFGSGCDAVGTCTDGYIATVMSYAAAYATAIATGTAVDLSGVSVSTGSGTTAGVGTVDSEIGSSDYGAGDGGAWQGNPPASGDESWQGGPGGNDGWHGGAPEGDSAADPGNQDEPGPGDDSSTGDQGPDDGEFELPPDGSEAVG